MEYRHRALPILLLLFLYPVFTFPEEKEKSSTEDQGRQSTGHDRPPVFIENREEDSFVLFSDSIAESGEKEDEPVSNPVLWEPSVYLSSGVDVGFIDGADDDYLTLLRTSLGAHYGYFGAELTYVGTVSPYEADSFNDELDAASAMEIESESIAAYLALSPNREKGIIWRIKAGLSKTNLSFESVITQDDQSSTATRSKTNTGASFGASAGYRWENGFGVSLNGHYFPEDLSTVGLSVDYNFSLRNF